MGRIIRKLVAVGCSAALLAAGFSGNGMRADAAKKCSLNKTKITLTAGGAFQLKVKGVSKAKITYSSNKEKIATVTRKGKIKAKKAGKAIITVKIKKNKQSWKKVCRVTVRKAADASAAPATSVPVPATDSTSVPVTQAPDSSPVVTSPAEATAGAATQAPEVTEEPSPYAPSYKSMEHNNPLLTNSFACDPTAMVYDGRVYVYMTNDSQHYEKGQHQEENTYGYINSIHIISSDDMVNWTDHGTFQITGEDGICSWANCCWAPSAVHKTVDGEEKFYVYFTNGGWSMGVVEADSPIGPFRDIKGKALYTSGDDGDSKASALDPAVFIDDDGSAYIVYGGTSGGTRLRKLNSDMMSFASDPINLQAPYFFEASWLNKINGKYYFSYCTDWVTRKEEYADLGLCSIAYMTADSPEGPYTYGGEVLPNCGTVFDDVWGNNHHSIIEFQGEYYIFYQTRTLETAMGIELGFRSTHVNKLTIREDGSIETVQQDREGVDQLKPFDPYQETPGTTAWNTGGMNVIHFGTDDKFVEEGAYMETALSEDYQYSWIGIKNADFGEESATGFHAVLEGQPNTSAVLSLRLDELEGPELGQLSISFDADGNAVLDESISEVTGTHDLYFVFDGYVKNFKTWNFVK